jgi:hypothetical protein
MTPEEAKRHFTDMLRKLWDMEPSPWPFLCAAVLLEYLAKMAIGPSRNSYKDFIKSHMRKEYRQFQFANGEQNLPEQIYHVLRCGIVHSFSLTPDLKYFPNGRDESIVIAYAGEHLKPYSGTDGHHTDAVCFVFQDFADDIKAALEKVFDEAVSDATLRARMEQHLNTNPPVKELSTDVSGSFR